MGTASGNSSLIMLSYNHNHKDQVKYVHDSLVDNGYSVWMDETCMGHKLLESMALAVQESHTVILFMSAAYENSGNCEKEYVMADQLKKNIVPVYIEDGYKCSPGTALYAVIAGLVYLDFSSEPKLKSGFPSLIRRLKALGISASEKIGILGEEKLRSSSCKSVATTNEEKPRSPSESMGITGEEKPRSSSYKSVATTNEEKPRSPSLDIGITGDEKPRSSSCKSVATANEEKPRSLSESIGITGVEKPRSSSYKSVATRDEEKPRSHKQVATTSEEKPRSSWDDWVDFFKCEGRAERVAILGQDGTVWNSSTCKNAIKLSEPEAALIARLVNATTKYEPAVVVGGVRYTPVASLTASFPVWKSSNDEFLLLLKTARAVVALLTKDGATAKSLDILAALEKLKEFGF